MAPAYRAHEGERIEFAGGKLRVPDRPVIPYIEGDGTGPDIWRASQRVFDAAVRIACSSSRGIAPGANISDRVGLFEATHGTAPKYAGLDMVNPGSVILSGVMMLDYLGWREAGKLILSGFETTIAQKRVTYDFERQMQGATRLKTSEFATAIIENMEQSAARS